MRIAERRAVASRMSHFFESGFGRGAIFVGQSTKVGDSLTYYSIDIVRGEHLLPDAMCTI